MPISRERAKRGIVRLLEIVARSAHHGMLTGAQGRSYEHTLRAGRSLELSGIARLLWGKGWYGRRFHALPQLARLPARPWPGRSRQRCRRSPAIEATTRRNGASPRARTASPRSITTRRATIAMGTAAHYRWNEWGYQETVLHLRLGDNPDAQIWINHPGETIQSGYGRPSYWGGSRHACPALHQYRGLAILDCSTARRSSPISPMPGSRARRSTTCAVSGDIALARSGDGLALLKGSRPLELCRRRARPPATNCG